MGGFLAPDTFGDTPKSLLIKRGTLAYQDSANDPVRSADDVLLEDEEKKHFTDVDTFGRKALEKQPTRSETLADPYVDADEPGRLAALTVHAALAIKDAESLRGRNDVKLFREIFDYAAHHVYLALQDEELGPQLEAYIAEQLYSETFDEPQPGRVIKQIVRRDDGHLYFELPIEQSHPGCLLEVETSEGEYVRTQVEDGMVYIPREHLLQELPSYLEENTFEDLMWYVEDLYDHQYVEFIAAETEQIQEYVDRLVNRGATKRLYEHSKYPTQLRLLVDAVKHASSDIAALDEPATAGEIATALKRYVEEEDETWMLHAVKPIDSPHKIAQYLHDQEDSPKVTIHHDREPQEYVLSDYQTNFRNINVTSVEDFLELPCFQNIHEYLLENGPTQDILIQFVDWMLKSDNPVGKEDIHDFFREHYSWYDRQTTEYQLSYQEEKRDEYDPISCKSDNKDFQTFCIGLDTAPTVCTTRSGGMKTGTVTNSEK